MKNKILIAITAGAAIFVIACATVYVSFDRIALFAVSKLCSLDISYQALTKDPKDGYVFDGLKVQHKKMGVGFFASRATLKQTWEHNLLKSIDFDFKLKDIHFLKRAVSDEKSAYDTLSLLVAIPFEGRWTYRDIHGGIEIFSNGLTLKNFTADGKEIRLLLSGDLYYNNIADLDIVIYFSKDVLKDIPPELPSLIMKDEPGDWKSFSVKLKGDYRSPSLQITGRQFQLNIGMMEMK